MGAGTAIAGIGSAIGGYMSYKGAKKAAGQSDKMMQRMDYYNNLAAGAIGNYESMIPYSAQFLPDIKDSLGQAKGIIGMGLGALGEARGAIGQGMGVLGDARGAIGQGMGVLGDARNIINSSLGYFGEGADMIRNGYGTVQDSLKWIGQAAGDYDRAREMAGNISPLLEEAMQWSRDSVDNAKDFQQQMLQYGQEYKGWTQGLMDDWEGMFGDMQQNLVDYYNNLDPVKYATEWKSTIEQSLNKEVKQLNESLAQTGVYTSGMKAQVEKERQFKQAELNANADLRSEEAVMGQVGDFYGKFGESRLQNIQNLYSQGLLNQAEMARLGYGAVGDAMRGAGQTALGAASGYGMGSGAYSQIGSGMSQLGATQTGIGSAMGGLGSAMGGLGSGIVGAGNAMGNVGSGYVGAGNALGNVGRGYIGAGSALGSIGGMYGSLGNAMTNVAGGYGGLLNAYQSIGDQYLKAGNAYNGLAGTYGNAGQVYGQSAAGYGSAAGKLFGNALGYLGKAIGA